MRIVVTTRTSLRHLLFLSLARERLGDHLCGVLIQELPAAAAEATTRPATLAERIRASVPLEARSAYRRWRPRESHTNLLRALALGEPPRIDADASLAELLAPLAPVNIDELAESVPVVRAEPNSDEAYEWLRSADLDLVLVFGGRILRGPWLDEPRLGALNVHYGILPFYRGSHSTEFALYHERFDRIGATVHYIDAGVDTGPIVRACRVDPREARTVGECRALVYRAGFDALLDCAVETLTTTERLPSHREVAANSHYAGRDKTSLVDAVAGLRLRIADSTFPRQQALLERAAARRSRLRRMASIARRAPAKFPPGVYIFLYHSVVAPSPEPWEAAYTTVATPASRFREHLEYLCDSMTPLQLEEAFGRLRTGAADRPYFVITFDDAYRNVGTTARPICDALAIRPTVFVNGAFCGGRVVYHRVLLALLIEQGAAAEVAARFNAAFATTEFTAESLFDMAKRSYRHRETEAVVEEAWEGLCAGHPRPRVHMNFDELRELRAAGWSIGNHTFSHPTLAGLSEKEIEDEVLGNAGVLEREGLAPIPWLSYPQGAAVHVGPTTERFMSRHPDLMGLHANGGVNVFPSRTEWQRIPVPSGDFPSSALGRLIVSNLAVTAALLRHRNG